MRGTASRLGARGTPLEQLDAAQWDATLPSRPRRRSTALRKADISVDDRLWRLGSRGQCAATQRGRQFLADVIEDPPGSRSRGWKLRLLDSPDGDESFMRGYEAMLDVASRVPRPTRACPQRSAQPQRSRRRRAAHVGVRLGLFDLRRLPLRAGDDRVLVAVVPSDRAERHRIAGRRPLQRHGARGAQLRRPPALLPLHIGLVHIAYNAFLGDFGDTAT